MAMTPTAAAFPVSFATGSSGEQDHSSGSAAKGITSMGVATHRTCFNCDSEVPSADCCRWGKVAYSCHICKTNYNRQSERIKTDCKLRTWWKNLSREQRIEWRRHCLGGSFRLPSENKPKQVFPSQTSWGGGVRAPRLPAHA